jgi:hypothetical protein
VEDHEDATLGDIEARIKARWEEFAERDLPALVAPIQVTASAIAAAFTESDDAGAATSEFATKAS